MEILQEPVAFFLFFITIILVTPGLIYLMFNAGLGLDVYQFMRVRHRAGIFGLLTFTFPQIMGMGLGWLLGMDGLGCILLGSASKIDHPITITRLAGTWHIDELEKSTESDLLVIPGFGSRQRFLSSIGTLPERLAATFGGNLLILHFDN